MGRKALLGLVALILALTACSATDGSDTTTPAGDDPEGGGVGRGVGVGLPAVALQQFDACDSLLGWIQTEAAERVGPYGFGEGGFMPFLEDRDVMLAADDGGAEAAADFAQGASVAAEEGGFSTTNVQEAGVDEPDLVKTDGEFLYVLTDQRLVVVEADADDPEVVDSMGFGDDSYPSEIILGEDRLYVIASMWITDPAALERIGLPAFEQSLFVIHEVLVGDDGSLEEGATLEIAGGYVTGRIVDGIARIVVRHDPGSALPFLFPSTEAAEERAAEFNRQVVMDTTIEDWLPRYHLTTAGGDERSGMLTECDRVTAPQDFSGMSTVSVMTLDMSDDLDTGDPLSLFGAADTVYASPTSLYAATYEVPVTLFRGEDDVAESDPDPDFTTAIHRFDITDDDGAEYVASGSVVGHLLNQFALSEHDGHLRVATTEGSPWWCCDEEASSSSVTILRTDGDELAVTGSVGDLGIDEQIFGVRFVGDVGYVVTFRQTDPLYVVDLSDPTAPSVTGELKITGYSAYLHPVSEDHVIGVGQEATLSGGTVGTKVSLFDVGDPADPQEVDRWVLERSSSPVEWDHKAFLWWDPESAAVVPVQNWEGEQFGAVAFDVGEGTLSERGRIVQGPPDETGPAPGCEVIERGDLDVDDGSELFWIFEEGALVVRCDDGAARGLPGFSCEPLENWGLPDSEIEAIVGDDTTIDVCWPGGDRNREIRRSVVVDDVLWTIGYSTVQANDLDSLDPLGRVDI